mmetsp:Transcript_32485/g.65814  ORF Transcript_32485/g.65814 Transcript_32485/m.65814 type:complete len:488 (+) Transcript_32485:1668-3131(+)
MGLARCIATAAALLLFLLISSPVMVASQQIGRFLWLSDLHYDPLYGQVGASGEYGVRAGCSSEDAAREPEGRAGCDSPLSLIESAVVAARDTLPAGEADFVLVTGDMARHGMDLLDESEAWDMLRDIFDAIAQLLQRTFPRTSIIFCLGNNDAIDDYYLDIADPKILGVAAGSNIKTSFVSTAETEMFRSGGYFARSIGGSDKVKVLVLNTVIYSVNHAPRATSNDPLGQLTWVESELTKAKANGGHVMIVGHVPPTIGSYRKSQFWQDRYLDQYLALIDEYADVVSAQLFGHLHSDEFRVLSDEAPPVLMTSSITPVFGGNPSFRVVEYDKDKGGVTDYATYYWDLYDDATSGWQKLYSFRQAYGISNMTSSSMQAVVESIRLGGYALDTFLSNVRVNAPQPPCDVRCRLEWACVLNAASKTEYTQCVSVSLKESQVILVGAVAGLVAFVFVGGIVLIFYRRRKRKNFAEIAEFCLDSNADDLSLT